MTTEPRRVHPALVLARGSAARAAGNAILAPHQATTRPPTARPPHGRTGDRTPCGVKTTCKIKDRTGRTGRTGPARVYAHATRTPRARPSQHVLRRSYARIYLCALCALCGPMKYKEKRESLPVRSPVRPCAAPPDSTSASLLATWKRP